MRISYIGNHRPAYSTECDVSAALEHLGHTVIRLQEDSVTWQQVRQAALASDLLLWTGTWDDAQPLKETIDTLRQCAMAGIPTATLHLDTFWSVSRGGREWWLSPMFFTRYVFTADGDYQDRWKQLGVDHYWLPPGVRHTAVHRGTPRPQYACDVALVGSDGRGYHEAEWPYRRELAEHLVEMCARNGWTYRNPGGRDPKVGRGEDLNDFYASTKVTVGDSLCLKHEAARYWSDRVPEATGRGGLLVMPQVDALDEMYGGAVPMYPWGDWKALESTIREYLEHPGERDAVIDRCFKVTESSGTYVNRVQTMLAVMRSAGAWS